MAPIKPISTETSKAFKARSPEAIFDERANNLRQKIESASKISSTHENQLMYAAAIALYDQIDTATNTGQGIIILLEHALNAHPTATRNTRALVSPIVASAGLTLESSEAKLKKRVETLREKLQGSINFAVGSVSTDESKLMLSAATNVFNTIDTEVESDLGKIVLLEKALGETKSQVRTFNP